MKSNRQKKLNEAQKIFEKTIANNPVSEEHKLESALVSKQLETANSPKDTETEATDIEPTGLETTEIKNTANSGDRKINLHAERIATLETPSKDVIRSIALDKDANAKEKDIETSSKIYTKMSSDVHSDKNTQDENKHLANTDNTNKSQNNSQAESETSSKEVEVINENITDTKEELESGTEELVKESILETSQNIRSDNLDETTESGAVASNNEPDAENSSHSKKANQDEAKNKTNSKSFNLVIAETFAKIKERTRNFITKRREIYRSRKAENIAKSSLNQREYEQKRRQRGAAGTLLLISSIVNILLLFFWSKQDINFMGVNRNNLDGALFFVLLNHLLSILLPSLLVYFIYRINPKKIIGESQTNTTAILLTILTGILISVSYIGFNNLSLLILDKLGFTPTFTNLYIINAAPSVKGFLILSVVLAIIPSFTYGFMFRGVMQTALEASNRKHLGIFFAATAASLYTNNPQFIVVPLIVSVYLAYVKDKADNLLITILMHFSINFGLLVIQYFMPMYTSIIDFRGSNAKTNFYVSIMFAVVALIVLFPISKACFQAYDDARADSKLEIIEENKKEYRLSRYQWFPVDWKYLVALLLLLVSSNFA